MSDPAAAQSYVFDQSHADHQRLIRQTRVWGDLAREACLGAGLRAGDRAIDVGCGPLGALPVLSELVGPAGTVIGLDLNASALAQARQALDALGVRVTGLVQGDVNALSPAVVAPHGPFDLAHCRFVLMHPADPGAALRRVASVVRPGGRIVAMDFLHEPRYPLLDPPVPAVERIFHLFFALMERKGGRRTWRGAIGKSVSRPTCG
jgi:ubiquinone/menaquinone biosynthesis C-methylase UbiE